jgi:hypothetical protein
MEFHCTVAAQFGTVCLLQIVGDMKSALKYQITYQYNRTALPANKTSTETNRITTAWDIVQTEVRQKDVITRRHYTDETYKKSHALQITQKAIMEIEYFTYMRL